MAKQYRARYLRSTCPVHRGRPAEERTSGRFPQTTIPSDDALLDALLRGVQVRQEMVRSLLEDSEEAEVRGFVGSMSTENGVGALMDVDSRHAGPESGRLSKRETRF